MPIIIPKNAVLCTVHFSRNEFPAICTFRGIFTKEDCTFCASVADQTKEISALRNFSWRCNKQFVQLFGGMILSDMQISRLNPSLRRHHLPRSPTTTYSISTDTFKNRWTASKHLVKKKRVTPSSAASSLLLFSPDASSASSLFAVSPFPSSRANSYFGGIGYFSASSDIYGRVTLFDPLMTPRHTTTSAASKSSIYSQAYTEGPF